MYIYIYICIYVYIYIYIYIYLAAAPASCELESKRGGACGAGYAARGCSGFGLYTILPSLRLYCVWQNKEGSVGRRILRNGHATVLE